MDQDMLQQNMFSLFSTTIGIRKAIVIWRRDSKSEKGFRFWNTKSVKTIFLNNEIDIRKWKLSTGLGRTTAEAVLNFCYSYQHSNSYN